MRNILAMSALLGALAFPSVSQASTITPAIAANTQAVYRTVATTEIVNPDGTYTEIRVITRYYVFGVE